MIGRNREWVSLTRLLERARQRTAAVISVVGEPGIGKTTLCDSLASQAQDMTVLRVVGIQYEQELGLAALFELLWPLRGRVNELVGVQREAARALLYGDGEPTGDLLCLAAAGLSLLCMEAADRPILVIVDDSQWIDDLSATAMQFAFRRLGADAVAVVVSARSGQHLPIGGPWPVLNVTGLGLEDATAILSAQGVGEIAPPVMASLLDATAGNPLALLEMARLLSVDQFSGLRPLPDPLPLGPGSELNFGRRLSDFPHKTRGALAVVAVAGAVPPSVTARALSAANALNAYLDPAEQAGVVRWVDGAPRFTHPLLRAAAYQAVSPRERREAHGALALALGDDNPERRAWHLAAAATGPSEDVAEALDQAASSAARRGGPASAAVALRLAAEYSPVGPSRTSRLIRAGEALVLAGRRREAEAVVDELLRQSDGSGRVRALVLRANLAVWERDNRVSSDVLTRIFEELSAVAPREAAAVGLQLSVVQVMRGRFRAALDIAARVVDLPIEDEQSRLTVECLYAQMAMFVGNRVPFEALVDHLTRSDLRALFTGNPLADVTFAQSWVWSERYDVAQDILDLQVSAARGQSAASRLPYPLTARCDLLERLGQLAEAAADADEALTLGESSGHWALLGLTHAMRARVAASQGDLEGCSAHAEAASRVGPNFDVEMFANHAVGLSSLSCGEPQMALVRLRLNLPLASSSGLEEPLFVPWQADYIEALAGVGNQAEAVGMLESFERKGATVRSNWVAGASSRCRVLLSDEDWRDHGERSINAMAALPIERARTHLALGRHYRRDRERRLAMTHLAEALRIFCAAGAEGWAAQTSQLLQTTGYRVNASTHRKHSLTPQELRICEAAAEGATNKEIAARFYVSPKTVEFHLAKAFAKLGVTNRTQAARALSEQLDRHSVN